jgi:hypothetical protein
MVTVDELSAEDKAVYDTISAGIFDKRRTPAMQDRFLRDALKDEAVSESVKFAIVSKNFRIPSGAAWAYTHFSGQPLFRLSQAATLNKTLAKIAAKNTNFTWAIVEHMFIVNTNIKVEAKEVFLINLNPEVADINFLRALTTIRKRTGLSDAVILNRIRRSDPDTIDIPDHWLLNLFTDTAPAKKSAIPSE